MIEKFNIWAQSLIVAIAVITIIEMLLPEGNSKKYVKVICSIYILFTIINPIINLDKIDFKNILVDDESKEVFNYEEEKIAEVYIKAYENEIKEKLIIEGYNLSDVEIKLDYSNENIESIVIKSYYISEEEKIKLKKDISDLYQIQNIIIN